VQRRLVLAIAGAVAAAVTVVGVGTLALATLATRHRDQDELARRLEGLSSVLVEVRPARVQTLARRLEPTLDADTVQVVRLDAPPGLLDAAQVERLRAGRIVSGRDGGTTYAAAPLVRTAAAAGPVRALLATDHSEAGLGGAGGWMFIVGAATVAAGVLLALRLARSLAGPVGDAERAARKIADGDLATRVPEPGGPEDELTGLVRSINTMAASLEQARQAEQDFLLSVSHDLRTPLTSIGGWAEALADGAARDPAAAGRIILAEAGRLDRLIRDLLDLARLRARTFTLDLRPVDLRDIATGTADGLRPDLLEAGLALEVEVGATPVVVDGDADRLAQITGNLIQNAGHHAIDRVRVAVQSDDGGGAVLVVDDDGPGIAPDERPKVFERLHTGGGPASGSGPNAGTGLGLAIVRELVHAMHGTVSAGEAEGGGARLVVRLPLGRSAATGGPPRDAGRRRE